MGNVIDIYKIMSLKKEAENKILKTLNEFKEQTGLLISTVEINTIDMPSMNGNDFLIAVNAKIVL